MKLNKGFTKVEILLVVGIIGLLGAISIGLLNNSQKKTRDAQRLSDARQIEAGLQMYYTKEASFSGACLDQGEGATISTAFCNSNNPYVDWSAYSDPRFGEYAACDSETIDDECECSYGLEITNKDEYYLFFCLEKGTDTIKRGLHFISRNGFDK